MGRFGWSVITPLYTWVNAHPYVEKPNPYTIDVLSWWAASLRDSRPMTVFPRHAVPDILVYMDASTSTRIFRQMRFPWNHINPQVLPTNVLLRFPISNGAGIFCARRAAHIFTALR